MVTHLESILNESLNGKTLTEPQPLVAWGIFYFIVGGLWTMSGRGVVDEKSIKEMEIEELKKKRGRDKG